MEFGRKNSVTIYFYTEKLIIREWCNSDQKSLVDGMNNLSVSKGFGTNFPYTIDDARKYLQKVKRKKQNNSIYFAVTQKVDNALVGGGGFYDRGNQCYAIGFWFREDRQSRGYGSQLGIAAVRYAIDVLGAQKVIAEYYPWNIRTDKIVKRLTYQRDMQILTTTDKNGEIKKQIVLYRKPFFQEN